MKAKNFRIGNVVKYDNRIFTIHSIADEFPTLDTIEFGIGVVDWNNLEGIPITEEWLEKLGFEKTDRKDAHVINVGEYDLYVACNSFSGTLNIEPSWFCSVAIGYKSQPMLLIKKDIHELQNLFFTLTGTELEIEQDVNACS